MRTIIDLQNRQLEALGKICEQENISRAELIRRVIDHYLQRKQEKETMVKSAFGIWKSKGVDALTYQQKLRDEWE